MMFWNNKKSEERESKALEAILSAFEADLKKQDEKPTEETLKPLNKDTSHNIANANLEDLIAFLSHKGILDLKEWEAFKAGNGKK